jgi:hypothetical protein
MRWCHSPLYLHLCSLNRLHAMGGLEPIGPEARTRENAQTSLCRLPEELLERILAFVQDPADLDPADEEPLLPANPTFNLRWRHAILAFGQLL